MISGIKARRRGHGNLRDLVIEAWLDMEDTETPPPVDAIRSLLRFRHFGYWDQGHGNLLALGPVVAAASRVSRCWPHKLAYM